MDGSRPFRRTGWNSEEGDLPLNERAMGMHEGLPWDE